MHANSRHAFVREFKIFLGSAILALSMQGYFGPIKAAVTPEILVRYPQIQDNNQQQNTRYYQATDGYVDGSISRQLDYFEQQTKIDIGLKRYD